MHYRIKRAKVDKKLLMGRVYKALGMLLSIIL